MSVRIWLLSLLACTILFGQPAPSFTARAIGPDPSQKQHQIAPGTIATLYGQDLGPEDGCVAEAGKESPELCGTQVFFGELAAPLLYVQKNQINLRVPDRTPEGAHSPLRVVHRGRSSQRIQVWVARRIDLPTLKTPGAVVEQLWRQWQAASSALSFENWSQRDSGAACQGPPEVGDGLGADQQWCHHCTRKEPHLSFDWAFYAFTFREPLACYLNRYWAWLDGVSETSLDTVYLGVAERLTQRYGTADDPGRIHAQGSAYWYRLRRWRDDGVEIYLYLTKPLFEPPHLGMLARAQPLLDAMAEDPEIARLHWGPKALDHEDLGRELNEALAATASCTSGQGTFQQIITSGERFIAERPESQQRRQVDFLLAQAYETWWSLSQTSNESAKEARQAAIRYYRAVILTEAGDLMAIYARRRLPRLELGIDTNQRRFFCSMD